MRGTVRPAKNFNPERDAALLHANLRGLAADSSSSQIINILSQRSNAQRVEISLSYREIFDRDLIQDVKSGGTNDFQHALVAMLLPQSEYAAASIRKAMKGIKTDGKVLAEIFLTKTKHEMQAIKDSRDDDDSTVSKGKAKQDAEILRNWIKDPDNNVNPDTILDMFCNRSFRQLGAALTHYHQMCPEYDIIKRISEEFHGEFKEALKIVIKLIQNSSRFFAEKLYHSMKGVGTDDETLIRIITTRAEIDLFDIKECFKQMYGKTLAKYIEGDTSGSYRKLLIAIVGQ